MQKTCAVLCMVVALTGCSSRGDGAVKLAGFDPAHYFSSTNYADSLQCRNSLTMSGALSQKCASAATQPASQTASSEWVAAPR